MHLLNPEHHPASPDTIPLFGLKLSCMTYRQTLDWLDREILQKSGPRVCVFSANVDQLIRRRHDPIFSEAYQFADLIIPDGMPVVWSARLAGRSIPERVTGIDLMYGMCQRSANNRQSCFLLGSQSEVVSTAVENLRKHFSSLRVCGWHDGYFSDDNPVVDAINATHPDILFVGMGSPRQELWLQHNFSKLHCRLALPVGGAFEVIAGCRHRAPVLVQKSGMEWAWRMLQEPRRLGKRYLIDDLRFVPLLMKEIRFRRTSGQA